MDGTMEKENGREGFVLLGNEVRCHNEPKKKGSQSEEKQSDMLIWNKKVPNTGIEKFKKIIEDKYNLHFNSYLDFHKWTVDNYEKFWEEVWIYFGVVFSKPYDEIIVKTGPGFLDNEWFSGAKFNYAENVLRYRDNREALVCLDEEGKLKRVTFAQLFEEVKLYAAAFRKHGLQKGDTVACYLSNKKEAVFAMLATTSIGAIWGGPQSYLGVKIAANVIQKLEPKFLLVTDIVQDECSGEEFNRILEIPHIAKSAPTIERIIIVPSKTEELQEDISHIPNSYSLGDFLASGKTPSGDVPDIVFEQLPFDHPMFVCFTSGTTGLPKGPVHSAGCLLAVMVEYGLHCNFTREETIYSSYGSGWTIWDNYVSALSLGMRLFLYCGNTYYAKGGKNLWDIILEHRISYIFLATCTVDEMEKMNLQPKQDANFKNLKFIMVGSSPLKLQNYKYLKSIVKEDVFIGNLYSSTETIGSLSGCDLNSPGYACEVQYPSLGKDVKVFDQEGRSVIGERGEVVVTNPCPSFPIRLWKDDDNEILNRTYFSKYPSVWQQLDEAYINPRTNGMVILGRSDDVIVQNGERFGPGDIYFTINDMKEIEDYICVGQNKSNGDSRAVLFLKLREGQVFTPELKEKVARKIESELWFYTVPELILEVESIPYNASNKRVESIIRKIVATNQIPQEVNIKNPECLEQYCNIPEIISYNCN